MIVLAARVLRFDTAAAAALSFLNGQPNAPHAFKSKGSGSVSKVCSRRFSNTHPLEITKITSSPISLSPPLSLSIMAAAQRG